ncbi:MAG: hypothetical protein ACYDHZ_09840 [Dehalococcoidia bacterium]
MSFKAFFLKYRTIILAVGIPLIVIIVVLSLPIVSVAMPVQETYWETETTLQPYTDNETYTDMVPYQSTETHTDVVVNQAVTYGSWSQSFKVDNPGTTVTINITNNGGGSYYPSQTYGTGDNFSYPYGPYGPYGPSYGPWGPWGPWYNGGWAGYPAYTSGQTWATVTTSYPAAVTKYNPVVKTREVTKYREVATQVRKEHTVTQNVRISVWQSLFTPQSSS